MKTRTIQQKYKILQYIAKIIFVHKKHGRHIAYAPVFYVFLTLSDVRLKPYK